MSGIIRSRDDYSPVTLACGHTVVFYPVPFMNDVVFCTRHWDYTTVIAGGPEHRAAGKLRIRCRSCQFARYETAKRSNPDNEVKLSLQAESHMLRYDHVIDLKRGRSLIRTFQPARHSP